MERTSTHLLEKVGVHLTCQENFSQPPLSVSVASHESEFPGWLHLFGIFVDTPVNLMLILSDIGDTPQIIIERLCDSCLMKLFFLLNDAKEAAFISA